MSALRKDEEPTLLDGTKPLGASASCEKSQQVHVSMTLAPGPPKIQVLYSHTLPAQQLYTDKADAVTTRRPMIQL
eukprot:4216669-Pleurochrysis_carterae.AAC.1